MLSSKIAASSSRFAVYAFILPISPYIATLSWPATLPISGTTAAAFSAVRREIVIYGSYLDSSDSLAGRVPIRPGNFLRRVLKPAAIRAGVGVSKTAAGEVTTALSFESLQRTSSTLFGARAKNPKSTQAHMRHADPQITVRHYQQAIPAAVKAAAIALETDLLEEQRRHEERLRSEVASARPV